MSVGVVRAHVHVRGRVQGVYFRATAVQEAGRLGLDGWVRNLPDGSVEAVAEGPREAVEQFVTWCASGPPHARVDDVAADWQSATGREQGFSLRR